MNIIELLKQRAQETPDKLALIHKGEKVTYRELQQRTSSAAAFFTNQGLSSGQKALLLIPLSIELYIIFLGLVRSGITIVLIDPSAGRDHVEQALHSVAVDAFIATPKAHLLRYIKAVGDIRKKFTTNIWLPGSKMIRYPIKEGMQNQDIKTTPDHPALITFTSGSTGIPKGISRSHEFLIKQHQAIDHSLPSAAEDIELNTLPVFILSNLASGITTVIPDVDVKNPATADAEEITQQIRRDKVNRLLASPAFCQNLADHLQTKGERIEAITKIFTGGGPVFPNLLKQLSHCFPNADIVAVYGSTEAEPIAHISIRNITESHFEKMQQGGGLLTGQPVSDISLAILPDQDGTPIGPYTEEAFNQLILPPMACGEIVVAGDHVQKGYISGDSRKTKFTVADTIWHRTGDAGYIDQQGRLWLQGRCSAKIAKQGELIYPFAIEAAAMSFPEVQKAAFIELNGEATLAIETNTTDHLLLHERIKEKLKKVDSVRVVKTIPVDKRHNSKILYPQLAKQLSES